MSENFLVSPSGVDLSGDRVAKVKIKSLKDQPVEISRIDLPNDAPIQVRQVKVDGQVQLEFQNFQPKDNHKKQVPWSEKIQLVLRDSFMREACWLTILKL